MKIQLPEVQNKKLELIEAKEHKGPLTFSPLAKRQIDEIYDHIVKAKGWKLFDLGI